MGPSVCAVRMNYHRRSVKRNQNTSTLVTTHLSGAFPCRKFALGLAPNVLDHAHTINDDEPLVKHCDLEHRVVVL